MDRNDIISDIRRGLSDREIARQRHHSRHKIAQTRREFEKLLASDPDNVETLLTVQPRYKDRKSPKRKFTQEIAEYINKCYRDNIVKISTGQRKQTKM